MYCVKWAMGKGDNSVVCCADSWMCDDCEVCEIICHLDTRVSYPTKHVSALETAVEEPVVLLHFGISNIRICRNELGADY